MDDFPDYVPLTPDFQLGYMEGASKQHWIVNRKDLGAMYECVTDKNEITLWCDKKLALLQKTRDLVNVKVRVMMLLFLLANLNSRMKN